jgi:ATP-dependent helicase HrpA
MLRLKDQVKYLRKNLPDIQSLCLLYQSIGSCESLKSELIETAFDRVFIDGRPLASASNVFEARLDSGRSGLVETANALCGEIKNVLAQYHQTRQRLDSNGLHGCQTARVDIESQLSHLVYTGFIRCTPAQWLSHLPRYLEAIELRINRLLQSPIKDQQLQREIDPYWRRCIDYMAAADDEWRSDQVFLMYRWMLEEYRVSLFAQRLGTSLKTSSKRLETLWRRL